jgi:hypothetical protein
MSQLVLPNFIFIATALLIDIHLFIVTPQHSYVQTRFFNQEKMIPTSKKRRMWHHCHHRRDGLHINCFEQRIASESAGPKGSTREQ